MYNKFRGLSVRFAGFSNFRIVLQLENPWTGSTVLWTNAVARSTMDQRVARTMGLVTLHRCNAPLR
jgi:hypothetical protein